MPCLLSTLPGSTVTHFLLLALPFKPEWPTNGGASRDQGVYQRAWGEKRQQKNLKELFFFFFSSPPPFGGGDELHCAEGGLRHGTGSGSVPQLDSVIMGRQCSSPVPPDSVLV